MLLKLCTSNKILLSVVICSLPLLPFSDFLSKKTDKDDQTNNQPDYSESQIDAFDMLSARVAVPDLIAPGSDIGMWVWHRDYLVDAWERIIMLDFCKSHGITRIFVQVHFDYTDNGYELANKEAWNELLGIANLLNIKVDALEGASEMGFAVNRSDTLDRLRAVLDFQMAQPKDARFSGIHYDIEPYTTDRWKNGEQDEVAFELLETLYEIRKLISATDPSLTLANDIPFWYDGDPQYIVKFNGSEKFLNEHIQDVSDFIGIMSYRTQMTGSNSVSDIASGELAYGAKIGRPVFLSIETVSLPETPQITFFGRSPVEVASAVRELVNARKDDTSFGGVFLHEYKALREIGKLWDLSALN